MWLPQATPADVAVVSLTVLAAVSDLRSRRIPNVLTVTGACAGLLYSVATGGAEGLLVSLQGLGLGLLLWLPFYALGGMGAGDVKLLAAIGAWVGPSAVLRIALYASIAGALMALAVALRHRYLKSAYQNLWILFATWRVAGIKPIDSLTLESSQSPRLAYALPTLAGVVIAAYLR
jgi:prepilin peptidase CpaA